MRIDIDDKELEEIRKKKIEAALRHMNKKEVRVKVYRTSSCPYCHMAAEYLRSRGVEFEEIDVGNDMQAAMEMVRKSGQMGVPVIDIDGKIIIGFNRPAIDAALAEK